MKKSNKYGFTLSEVLITLAIVGVLAVLIIPGLIKDTNNRAMVSLLEGTTSILANSIQNELIANGTMNVQDTNVYNNPMEFMKKRLDVKNDDENKCYGTEYRSINGGTITPTKESPVMLSNGVAVDILTGSKDENYLPVGIDLNGTQPPNIAGVDLWTIYIVLKTDTTNGRRSGDIGSNHNYNNPDNALALCKGGNPGACYTLLELKGFDSKYLEK